MKEFTEHHVKEREEGGRYKTQRAANAAANRAEQKLKEEQEKNKKPLRFPRKIDIELPKRYLSRRDVLRSMAVAQ
jgi:hypothetical protein